MVWMVHVTQRVFLKVSLRLLSIMKVCSYGVFRFWDFGILVFWGFLDCLACGFIVFN